MSSEETVTVCYIINFNTFKMALEAEEDGKEICHWKELITFCIH